MAAHTWTPKNTAAASLKFYTLIRYAAARSTENIIAKLPLNSCKSEVLSLNFEVQILHAENITGTPTASEQWEV